MAFTDKLYRMYKMLKVLTLYSCFAKFYCNFIGSEMRRL